MTQGRRAATGLPHPTRTPILRGHRRAGRPPRRGRQVPGDRGQQPGGRRWALRSDVGQHKAAGAVGGLDHAGGEAGLAEQSGLLVAGDAADWHASEPATAVAQCGGRDNGEAATGGPDVGEDGALDTEERAQLVGPGALVDVVEKGPAGVGRVGGEDPAVLGPAQVPEHPGVDRAQGQVADRCRRQRPVLGEPGHLRGREIGVEHEPGARAHEVEVARLAQRPAVAPCPLVLPDDGSVERRPAGAVPGDHRLALVGDAEGGDPLAPLGDSPRHLEKRGAHVVDDLGGIVLDPAGAREVLRELPVGDVGDLAGVVDDERAHPGGPRIHSHDARHGCRRYRPHRWTGWGWWLPGRCAGHSPAQRGARPTVSFSKGRRTGRIHVEKR